MNARTAAAFVLFALLFGWRVEETRIGSGYIDPIGKIQAQDEAVYTSASIRMAEQGGWMTPVFLDRFFLYKPPLLYWLSGLSARTFGIRNRNLRLPSILAAAFVCTVALRYGGWLAAALIAANPLFFTMARRNMTDAILCAAIVALVAAVLRDGKLERRGTRVLAAIAIAAAILVKSTAGAIPLAILVVAGAVNRTPIGRLAGTVVLALAIAAPWFAYQYQVNQRWFWTEFVEVELLAYGAGAPPQAASESGMEFYARRLWYLDPWLCLLALASLPALLRSLRRPAGSEAAILAAWTLMLGLALAGYQYRNATYLLPAIPALALIAARFVPMAGGPVGGVAAVALVGLRMGGGAYHAPQDTLSGVELIEQRCAQGRTNELILVNPPDQFYTTVLPVQTIRYALPEGELPPKGFSLDFRSMGIILSVDEYLRMDQSRRKYSSLLREWGLFSDASIGTVIAYRDQRDLERLVGEASHADIFAARTWGLEAGSHRIGPVRGGMVLFEALAENVSAKPARACRL